MAHLPPVDTDTCQLWYSEVGIDIDFDAHKCFGYEDGRQARFIRCRLIDRPLCQISENTYINIHLSYE